MDEFLEISEIELSEIAAPTFYLSRFLVADRWTPFIWKVIRSGESLEQVETIELCESDFLKMNSMNIANKKLYLREQFGPLFEELRRY